MDRMSLRALKGAPITCLLALQMLEHAGINDLVDLTGYDSSTVTRAARALLSAGLVRRKGTRGDFTLTGARPAGGETEAHAFAAGLTGTIPDAEHEPENNRFEPEKNRIEPGNQHEPEKNRIEPEKIGFEPGKNRIDARSSSSSLISSLYQVDDKRTTTTTPGEPDNSRFEPAKSRIEPEHSRFADDDGKNPGINAEKSRLEDGALPGGWPSLPDGAMRIVDLLVERTTCPRARAILAVAQSLRRGWHPACVELQAYYWSAYVWSYRASSVQNPGMFAAARIAQCMPAPAAAAALMKWDDYVRLEQLKGELEEVKAAERRAARALEQGDDRDDDGNDGESGEDGDTPLEEETE